MIVEEVLTALFEQIPTRDWYDSNNFLHTTPKPVYHYGDVDEANKLISAKDGATYPLIFQISTEEVHTPTGISTRLKIILATRNRNVSMYNTERWATSYRNVLVPLYEDVKACLEQSNAIATVEEYEIQKVPNYSETESKDKTHFVDIVDAIILTTSIEVVSQCTQQIIFNR